MFDINILKGLNIDTSNIDCEKSYVSYYDNTNHIIDLFLKKEKNLICKECSSKSIIVSSSKISKMRVSTIISNNTLINVHLRIYKCLECNKYFTQENPFKSDGRSISIQKEYMILEDLRNKNSTYTSVANKYHVSPTYVTNLFDRKVDIKRGKLPEILCIDEVYSRKLSKHSYCFVLYSPRKKRIIDILDSRCKLDLIDYFARIPQKEKDNVKYVSMDLYENYRDVIHKCLPKAKICADPFHVVVNLNKCFQNIRIRTMKNYEYLKHEKSNYYWLYKKYWKFLLIDESNIPDGVIYKTKSGMELDKYQIKRIMLNLNETLEQAYELKEAYRNFVSTANIETAQNELNKLIENFTMAHIPEYAKFINIMNKWHDEIINSFIRVDGRKITNGPMERINNDIKTMIRLSFGSTNFIRMKNRIMFALNYNEPILASIKKETNKKISKKRGAYKSNK